VGLIVGGIGADSKDTFVSRSTMGLRSLNLGYGGGEGPPAQGGGEKRAGLATEYQHEYGRSCKVKLRV